MTFWREAVTSAVTTTGFSSAQLSASSMCSTLSPLTATAPNPTASVKKKPSPWLKFQGLVLAPELRARLAALPLASVQQIIAACDAAMEAAAVPLRYHAVTAAAAGGGGNSGGHGDDDDDSGWSEVRRPGARRVSGGGGRAGRLDTSVLIKCLARTLMKVR